MEEKLIYIDGEFYKKLEVKILVFDYGFLYGDGVFEGIRVYNGKIFKCKEYVDRLYQAVKAIYMEILILKEEMIEVLKKICRINNIREGYIRFVVL